MSRNENISGDLIWEVVRSSNAFLVKSKSAGGIQFSRDPFNLTNKHSRKHAGFVNDKAISLVPGEKGGVHLKTKKSDKSHTPNSHHNSHAFKSSSSNQKIFKNVANHTAKHGYRGDLNRDAIARASAIKNSQREKKEMPAAKPRGAKATKAAE